MKREMNGKLAMIVAAAMLCMTGCGMESPIQDDSAIVGESLPGMVKVEETAEEETSVQEKEVESSENSVNQVEYDVQKILEDAEKEASASQRKLMEDPSLNQADMNTLERCCCTFRAYVYRWLCGGWSGLPLWLVQYALLDSYRRIGAVFGCLCPVCGGNAGKCLFEPHHQGRTGTNGGGYRSLWHCPPSYVRRHNFAVSDDSAGFGFVVCANRFWILSSYHYCPSER